MNNTRRIAYNTIVQIISRILTVGISLVTLGYLTRYLGVEGYGQYNLIFAYLGLFGVLVDFGFFLLQVKEIVTHPDREEYILGNILGLKIVLSLVVFAVAYLVALWVYDDPLVTSGILVGIISQASISMLHIPNSLFQAKLQMQNVAISNVLSRITYGGAVIWAIQSDLGMLNIIAVISASNLLTLLWMMYLANRSVRIRPQWDFGYWKKFITRAIPLGAMTVLAMIYFRIDAVMLEHISGSYALGIYSTPYRILDVILSLPVIFMSSVFPIMTQAISQGSEHLQRIFTKALNYSIMGAAPLVAGSIVLALPIITLLAGPEFAPAAPALQVLVWVTGLSFIGAVLNYTVIAVEQQRILIFPYTVATAFNILANIIVIPRYSYMGASYVTVATELLVVIWAGIIVYRRIGLRPIGLMWVKPIAAALGMSGIILLTSFGNIFFDVVVGVISYSGLLIVLGALPLNVLKQMFRR